MKLKSLVFALVFSVAAAYAPDIAGAELPSLQDAWDKVTDVTRDALKYVKGNGNSAERQDSAAASTSESRIFSKVWKKFAEVSNEAVNLATDAEKKKRTMLEFLTAREPRYVRLLKKAQDILADSEANEQFEKIDELTLRNKKNQETILKLKRDRVVAPLSSYNPLADTRERIDKKIANLETEMVDNKEQIRHLQSEIMHILDKNGLHISMEELKYLIVSAEGSELVRLMSIADNMKRIQGVIERELLQDKNNVSLAKYYTGMYFISLETYLSAHDTVLEKIPLYRKRLKDIVREAAQNRDEARKLRSSASDADVSNLEANININERVLSVARLYDDLLRRRMDLLQQSRNSVEKKVRIASNTYKTIVNGSALITLINTESGEFSLLVNFAMPELKMIYDSAMLNAFMEIADRIKSEQ